MARSNEQPRRAHACSACGMAGHNRRACQKTIQVAPRVAKRPPRKKVKREASGGLKGPEPVVGWLDVNPRRGASPCVLKRKFGYIVTHHTRLATQEKNLQAIQAHLRGRRSISRTDERRLAEAEARVENQRKWLDFSVQTMENALRYAVARISPDTKDGKLLRKERPRNYSSTERMCKDTLRWIRYFSTVMEEFNLAKAAAAGHSGSNAALQELMRRSSKVMAYWKSRSGREKDDANQGAIIGLLEAAEQFNPCHGKFARFTTFAGSRVRRRSQVRAARDCKPGTTLVTDKVTKKRKQVNRGTLDVADDCDDHADRYHPTAQSTDTALVMDVRRALKSLGPQDAEIATRRFQGNETVKDLAEEFGVTTGVMRRRINQIQERLATRLSGYGLAS
jgi:RNA polymerase sigma factor (sigma-70 family)